METITPFPDPKAIEAEACAWIAQLDGAEPSQADLAALREWMSRSPAHRRAIERLSSLWDDLNIFTELAVPRPGRPGTKGGRIMEFFRRLARPVPATRMARMAMAGAMLSLVAATLILLDPAPEATTPPADHAADMAGTIQSDSYVTGIGQQQSIPLSDGSRVTLNTNSRIEINLSARRRDIRLTRGEAMFEVAPDVVRPFRVYAGNGLVRAIGTAFTVHLKDPDNVSVTVAQGEVELVSVPSASETGSGGGRNVPAAPLAKIRAGQRATFGVDIESIQTLERAELSRRLSWREGTLHFDGEPLSEAVREVSRYTTQKIVILDPALRELRIGGYFKVGETEAMFEALESSFGVRVERINEDLVHLSARR